jgi:hypothetical protein
MDDKQVSELISELYGDNVSNEHVFTTFRYLTNESRGDFVTEEELWQNIYEKTMGELIKKLDPIAFQLIKQEQNDNRTS